MKRTIYDQEVRPRVDLTAAMYQVLFRVRVRVRGSVLPPAMNQVVSGG
jgi:hypothetical protein